MNILESLTLCKAGERVRPKCWVLWAPSFWVEFRNGYFVTNSKHHEIPHALRLGIESEFLGEWEVYPKETPT